MKTQRKLVTSFQQSLVATVYVDQSEQKRRESSLVISGLQESKIENMSIIINIFTQYNTCGFQNNVTRSV